MVEVLRALDGLRGAILPSSTRKIQEVRTTTRGPSIPHLFYTLFKPAAHRGRH